MKKLSNFQLKIMALLFMLMDHMLAILKQVGDIPIPIWFGYIGRLAAPIFFFMIVEGFFHTKDRKAYFTRLLGMGILMIGVNYIFKLHNNIFLSLACGVALMGIIEFTKINKKNILKFLLGILGCILVSVAMLFTEASVYGILMILIFYFARSNKFIMSILYIFFSLIFIVFSIGPDFIEAIMYWDYQWMMVFAIIPILLYNGKRGFSNKLVQWLFYIFYPAHLIILTLISKIV
ncbi:MAG: TraX family protein [Proteocatella sp.]